MAKIAHLTSVHPPLDLRIFYKECRTLAENGYEVVLIADHFKEEVVGGIKIVPFSHGKNRFLRIILSSLKMFFLAIGQRADLYHFHDPELIPMGLMLKLFGKKVIYDVHEDYGKAILSYYYLPFFARKTIARLTNAAERMSSIFFNAIISATEDISLNFRNHRTRLVLRNYPILSLFSRTNGSVPRGESGEKEGNHVFHVIYAGILSPERGLTQAVQSMGLLDESRKVRLVLCGAFSPESYEEEIRSLKGFAKVDYYGFVDFLTVPSFLRKSDVGIVNLLPFPNYINSMPNKLFEYMATGLPVVVSHFPLWKEIVGENHCGLSVDPLQPRALAEAIEWLMDHPAEARQMGENGRRAVLEKYNWELESRKLLSFYEDLLSRKRAPSSGS